MSSDARINNEPGFILHTYPFKETSVVAEVFTRSHGRVALIARGARRPTSALRGLMQPFTPLLLSWFGKSELKTLHAAEWQGGLIAPQGRALMCGFYLNELLLRLLARGDAHELLYDRYVDTLDQLAGEACSTDYERILRPLRKKPAERNRLWRHLRYRCRQRGADRTRCAATCSSPSAARCARAGSRAARSPARR